MKGNWNPVRKVVLVKSVRIEYKTSVSNINKKWFNQSQIAMQARPSQQSEVKVANV